MLPLSDARHRPPTESLAREHAADPLWKPTLVLRIDWYDHKPRGATSLDIEDWENEDIERLQEGCRRTRR